MKKKCTNQIFIKAINYRNNIFSLFIIQCLGPKELLDKSLSLYKFLKDYLKINK